MFGTIHTIHLMPQQVVASQLPRRFSNAAAAILEAQSLIKVDDAIEWATGALQELLAKNKLSGKLHIAFSDMWVHYDLFSLGENELSDEDAGLLARTQFASQYPAAADWPLRLAQQGRQLLVAGVNPSLMAAIERVTADSGCRLARLEPWFAKVLDSYEKELVKADGWLLFDEPGMMIVALLKQGVLTSLHCQYCANDLRESTAQLLLNRQSALLGYPAGEVRIFSFSGAPLALLEPWRCSQFLICPPHAGSTALFAGQHPH